MSDEERTRHTKIGSLDPVKRGFMNKEKPEEFREALEKQSPPFRYFVGEYLGSVEFEGKPEFVISNRNKGFVQSDILDKKRNYLFVAFSCSIDHANNNRLVFRSYWIVNSNDPMEKLLEDDYSNFNLTETDLSTIIEGFRSGGPGQLIGLSYLH